MNEPHDMVLQVLARLEGKVDGVQAVVGNLVPRIAALERQDEINRERERRFADRDWPALERRVERLEEDSVALRKVHELEAELAGVRATVTQLELDKAERRGMTTFARAAWTVATAGPGVTALLYQLLGGG